MRESNNDISSVDAEATENINSMAPAVFTGSAHANALADPANTCAECDQSFRNKATLEVHVKKTLHLPYRCNCTMQFSRIDVLQRHIYNFQPATTYGCPYCTRFDGTNAFARIYHLMQHIVGFHRIQHGVESHSSVDSKHKRVNKDTSAAHIRAALNFERASLETMRYYFQVERSSQSIFARLTMRVDFHAERRVVGGLEVVVLGG